MKKYLIIVAGGTGTRMKGNVPKQFINIAGKPVIVHAIDNFLKYDDQIKVIVVSHKDLKEELKNILSQYFPKRTIDIADGGETRFHSVNNGLKMITETDGVVAIHDAARPLVSLNTIRNCFETAVQKGNAIPAVAVFESLRVLESGTNKAVKRSDYKIVQTPQCFKLALIKKAFEQTYNESFTDDATVLEQTGEKINLVEGNIENIKITTSEDLIIAESFLK